MRAYKINLFFAKNVIVINKTIVILFCLGVFLSISSHRSDAAILDASSNCVEFDVATIKPSDPSINALPSIQVNSPGRFSVTNMTMADLIEYAYGIHSFQLINYRDWADSVRYDVNAKAVAVSEENLSNLGGIKRKELWEADLCRIRNLLAERFHLATHTSTKIMPVYELIVTKNGSKLRSSKQTVSYRIGRGRIVGHGITIQVLVDNLSHELSRTLIDKTGLTDSYDMDLSWTPDDETKSEDASSPSLRTALQQQLGLQIVSLKGPVEVLTIDHLERPSPN